MPERQSRHPDNDLIDRAQELGGGTGSSAGGTLQRDVGSRAELSNADGSEPEVERVRKSDEGDRVPRPKTNRQ
ncbi:hypothetical protein ABVV53_07130 [Novosphingobium sp. RD2P27]|uniref:Uncharacterized protein n=1 Tax=Novosphingobium kalidii TaxID=3230299 RepID=A0ABV2D054_9SPHN